MARRTYLPTGYTLQPLQPGALCNIDSIRPTYLFFEIVKQNPLQHFSGITPCTTGVGLMSVARYYLKRHKVQETGGISDWVIYRLPLNSTEATGRWEWQ